MSLAQENTGEIDTWFSPQPYCTGGFCAQLMNEVPGTKKFLNYT